MSLLTIENKDLDQKCRHLLESFPLRFAGIINRKGILISGGFRPKITPYEEEEKLKMLYMQTVLDFSMKSDYNSTLGSTFYILTKREKVNVATIPLNNELLLLLSADSKVEIDTMVEFTRSIF